MSPPRTQALTLRDPLEAGRRRAAELGHPILVSAARFLSGEEDVAAAFAVAGPGVPRFYWARPSRGLWLAGVGEALRAPAGASPLPDLRLAHRRLLDDALIDAPDLPGAGPVCFAGVRFDPAAPIAPEWRGFGPGLLFLPRLLLSSTPQGAWLTFNASVSFDTDIAALERRLIAEVDRYRAPCSPVSSGMRVDAPPDLSARPRWEDALHCVLRDIAQGRLEKVVLARPRRVQADRDFEPRPILRRLAASHSDCLVFAVAVDDACFLGATPETIVRLQRGNVSSTCLAGTAPRSPDPCQDRLLGEHLLTSAKERQEHALVVQAVHEGLAGICASLNWNQTPSLMKLPTVQHLATSFSGRCSPSVHVLDLVERLHPTPAVAGVPRSLALKVIRESEGFDRGWYAGPIGLIDRHGDGDFAIALRCALVQGRQATLYTGAGILAGSDPEQEWAETELKLMALQSALAGE